MIRKMETSDIATVVAAHLASFPGFFLSFLGPRFLSVYYRGIVTASEGIALVFVDPGNVPAGFVAGSANPQGFYKRLLKNSWFKFGLACFVPVLKRPSAIKRILRAFTHPSSNPPGTDVAGLYSIGVLPALQGTGAGKKLVRAFLEEAGARGCKNVFLTTDRDNNETVNQFYAGLGFSIKQQYITPEGRRMNEYWIDLKEVAK